ncbi:hypothetical protein DSBG_0559 [Desulfosporosinus sp. BG]|nr:hypothetical protein DSBG_0559 [Desulfosporosinus sp. BG]
MTVHLTKMVRIWGGRIGFVQDRIKSLGEKGFNATGEDV